MAKRRGRQSNYQFDSWPLKVRNRPDFLACRWHATYLWKDLDKGYNFALDLISIKGLHTKLWASKVTGVLGPNAIWMLVLWPDTKYTIRGKVVASPKSGPWWALWICVCPWLIYALKVLKLCTNQLVVWFVQVQVSDWCLSFFLVPIPELQHAPLPSNCYELGSVPHSLLFCYFHLRLTFECIKKLGSAS
jgi:hypothetical protein